MTKLTKGRHLTWRDVVLLVGLVVGGASGWTTAVGLHSVAAGCGVDPQMAWLYVPITDGLGVCAYGATSVLNSGKDRVYAWCVVVLAAGLSAVAQGSHLWQQTGTAETVVSQVVSNHWVRFGVGCWPAVSVAVTAHLLWLVFRARAQKPLLASPGSGEDSGVPAPPEETPVSPGPTETPGRVPDESTPQTPEPPSDNRSPGDTGASVDGTDDSAGDDPNGLWRRACVLPCCGGKLVGKATYYNHQRKAREAAASNGHVLALTGSGEG